MTNSRIKFFLIYPFAIAVIALLYKFIDPSDSIFFPKCPVKSLTGLDCPGCGGQRAIHHLLNGELLLAFQQNPFLFILAPYLLLGFYLQLVPNPTTIEIRMRRILYGQTAIIVLGILILVFTIFRNIV